MNEQRRYFLSVNIDWSASWKRVQFPTLERGPWYAGKKKVAAWVQGSREKRSDLIGHDAPRIWMRSHSIIHHNIAIAHVTSLHCLARFILFEMSKPQLQQCQEHQSTNNKQQRLEYNSEPDINLFYSKTTGTVPYIELQMARKKNTLCSLKYPSCQQMVFIARGLCNISIRDSCNVVMFIIRPVSRHIQ
jgi:hypothetical protein